MPGAVQGLVQQVFLFFIHRAHHPQGHYFGKIHNRIERGAQLVAHARQELAFHLVSLAQFFGSIYLMFVQLGVLDSNRYLLGQGSEDL